MGNPLVVNYVLTPLTESGRGIPAQGGFVLSPRGAASYVFTDGFDVLDE